MNKNNIIKSWTQDIRNFANKEQYNKVHKQINDEVAQKTLKYQQKYGFKVSTKKDHEFHNNEADAFKHTFGSTLLSLNRDNFRSWIIGNMHEMETNKNPSNEENMDKWNNYQGRRIADEIRKEYGKNFYKLPESVQDDIIAKKVMQKMRNGDLITNPSDKRKYTGFAADLDNISFKHYSDEKGNKAIYLNDGEDISIDFLESLDTKDRLIYDTEFNPANVTDTKIIDRLVSQNLNGEKYTKKYLDSALKLGEVIYVESYTRADGTVVRGYYRRK